MECFNCFRPATKKLYVEPDFGFINTCDSVVCREKAEADLKRFHELAENARDRQGRSKEQFKFSEKIVNFAIIGCSIILFILILISFLNKQ